MDYLKYICDAILKCHLLVNCDCSVIILNS